MKKLLFVYNSKAGKSQISGNLCEIINVFTEAGYFVTAYPTQYRLDAYEKIKNYADKFDLVVVSGGDGTLSEGIKGIMSSESGTSLGYIPAGSTNDFARGVDIPRNMIEAARNAVSGSPFQIDIGSFNGEYYCYVAAFGAFTDVSYETPQNVKNVLGHVAYFLEGMKRINKIEAYDMTIEHDGETIHDDFVVGLITNAMSIGGMKQLVSKDVVFDDGLFEVVLIKMPNNPMEFQGLLTKLLVGDLESKYFITFKTSCLRITCEQDVAWTLDGEAGGTYSVVEIENHQKALSIIVPEK